jgi:hypothetical protein
LVQATIKGGNHAPNQLPRSFPASRFPYFDACAHAHAGTINHTLF